MLMTAMSENLNQHCAFDQEARKRLHDFSDAIGDEGANRETHVIILRIGKSVQTFTQRIAQGMVWGLVILGFAVLVIIFGRNIGFKF